MSRPEEEMDLPGCFFFTLRYAGCSLLLWIIMFAAMIIVGLISLIFFR